MSRYIKSEKTLKSRVGKQVKVDGDLCNVTEKRGMILIDSVGGHYHAEITDIKGYLEDHDVASAGYTFKHKKEEKAGKPVPFPSELLGKKMLFRILDNAEKQKEWTEGMVGIEREEGCCDRRYFLFTNSKCFDGCKANDLHGYKYSWSLAAKGEDHLHYKLEWKELESVNPKREGLWSIDYRQNGEPIEVRGMLKYRADKRDWMLLTNDKRLDGASTDDDFKEGYKYSWWIDDGIEFHEGKGTYSLKQIKEETPAAYTTVDGFIVDKECLVTIKPETGKWEDETHVVTGMIVQEREEWFLLTNEKALDGSSPVDMHGYKYGWSLTFGKLKDQGVVLNTATFESAKCACGTCSSSSEDSLTRIAKALERIADILERKL